MSIIINDKAVTITENESISRYLLKRLTKEAGYRLKDLVNAVNDKNNTNFTDQNFANRLSADTIKLIEFIEYLNIMGYDMIIKLPDKEPEKESSFAELASQGYTECKSLNWSSTIIAGKDAVAAAEWIEANLNEFSDMDDTNEIILLLAASRKYKVKCKPVSNDPARQIYML